MAFLTVERLTKQDGSIHSVREISFALDPFQKIAIAGETGSGKSSLLKMIAGLKQPDSGTIYFEGKRVLGPEEKLMPGHPGIGYLSQHFELRNNYIVEDELGAKNKLKPEEADHIFSVCRIQHLLKRRTNQLSGGEKQRIALARILISTPRLMLLDEPFSNLDMGHKQIIRQVVKDMETHLGITSVLVLHDAPDILSWADTILVLQDGMLIQQSTPMDIYRKPINEYCAALFGMYNLLEPAGVFAGFINEKLSGKKIFLRPEEIQLVHESEPHVKGFVQNIFFWGAYFTLDVLVGEELISVKVKEPSCSIGDEVFLTHSTSCLWYI